MREITEGLTVERVNYKAKYHPVNYNLILRQNKIDSIRFELCHNSKDVRVDVSGLASIIGQENINKVLSTSGNIAIVSNLVIIILED